MSLRRPTLTAGITVAVGAVPVLVYLWVALHRIGYAYELDWMEGGAVEQVGRVLAGHSLYAAPTLSFVGWPYPPLYWLVSAAVAKLTGLGFLPLRLVSFTSSLVVIGVIAKIVADETGDRVAAVVAAGLFAATYKLSGAWFDVARLDSVFLALTLVTLAAGRRARGVRAGVLVGLLAFLAFFTKQIALVALVPALLWLAAFRWRAGVAALALLVGLAGVSTIVIDSLTGGWYRYYVVDELSGQPWAPSVWGGFWLHNLLQHLWPLCALLLVALVGSAVLSRRAGRTVLASRAGRTVLASRAGGGVDVVSLLRTPLGYQGACVTGLLVASWLSRLHTGGYYNVLMPAYAACALIGGFACARLRRWGQAPALGVAAMLILQLALLAYPVSAQIPGSTGRRAGAELLTRLRALPGPILVLRHPWYATEVGKGAFADGDAMIEVLRSTSSRGARVLRRSLRGALDRDHVQAVVLDDGESEQWLTRQLRGQFRVQAAPITRLELRPLTDLRSEPTVLYIRR